mmetsp:Transcript_11349/g.30587  ORF Transcript_11349/g.30587 Transcript_11349/m.30587 type:complete len:536 (+) Transcript_11349:289-1896(+)
MKQVPLRSWCAGGDPWLWGWLMGAPSKTEQKVALDLAGNAGKATEFSAGYDAEIDNSVFGKALQSEHSAFVQAEGLANAVFHVVDMPFDACVEVIPTGAPQHMRDGVPRVVVQRANRRPRVRVRLLVFNRYYKHWALCSGVSLGMGVNAWRDHDLVALEQSCSRFRSVIDLRAGVELAVMESHDYDKCHVIRAIYFGDRSSRIESHVVSRSHLFMFGYAHAETTKEFSNGTACGFCRLRIDRHLRARCEEVWGKVLGKCDCALSLRLRSRSAYIAEPSFTGFVDLFCQVQNYSELCVTKELVLSSTGIPLEMQEVVMYFSRTEREIDTNLDLLRRFCIFDAADRAGRASLACAVLLSNGSTRSSDEPDVNVCASDFLRGSRLWGSDGERAAHTRALLTAPPRNERDVADLYESNVLKRAQTPDVLPESAENAVAGAAPCRASPSAERARLFTCAECGKSYDRRKTLIRHTKHVHLDVRTHECPVPGCAQAFRNKTHRDAHFDAVHLGVRRHICTLCKLSFASKSNLARHLTLLHH